jgi:hypothetical protein
MKTKIPQMGYVPWEEFSWNHLFLGNSMKMSQPAHDSLCTKINRFPKEQNCGKS